MDTFRVLEDQVSTATTAQVHHGRVFRPDHGSSRAAQLRRIGDQLASDLTLVWEMNTGVLIFSIFRVPSSFSLQLSRSTSSFEDNPTCLCVCVCVQLEILKLGLLICFAFET